MARNCGTAGLRLPLPRLERAHYGGVLRTEWGVATAESRPTNRQDREQLLEDQLQLRPHAAWLVGTKRMAGLCRDPGSRPSQRRTILRPWFGAGSGL